MHIHSNRLRSALVASVAIGAVLCPAPARAQQIVFLDPYSQEILKAIGRLVSSVRIGAVDTAQQVANATNTVMADFHTSLAEQQILRNHIITPATCAAVDSAQAAAVGQQQAAITLDGVQNPLDRRGEGQPGTNGHEGWAQSRQSTLIGHFQTYCSDLDVENGLCNAAQPIVWQDRDQQARSLFSIPTYNQDSSDAANAYATNLIEPMVPAAVRVDDSKTQQGQDIMVQRQQYNASVSLARYVIADILASHAPTITAVPPDLQRQRQLDGQPASNTASWWDATNLYLRYHSTLTYQNALQSMGTAAAVDRAIAQSIDTGNNIAWASYNRLNQIAALLAASVSYQAMDRYRQVDRREPSFPSPQIAQGGN